VLASSLLTFELVSSTNVGQVTEVWVQPPFSEADYVIGVYNSTYYYSRNSTTGKYDYLSSNATYVIQSSLNTFTDTTGGSLFFRTGYYYITNTIYVKTQGVKLYGSSYNRAIIKLSNGANKNMVDITGPKCEIVDLLFWGNSAQQSVETIGIYAHCSPAGQDLHLDHVVVYDVKGTGVKSEGSWDMFSNCFTESNTNVGWWIAGANSQLIGCESYKDTAADANPASIYITGSNNRVVGCKVYSPDSTGKRGIEIVGGSGNIIDACDVILTNQDGIYLMQASKNIVSNCIIKDCGKLANNTYVAIGLMYNGTTYSTYNVISNNIISSSQTNKPKYGIQEENANCNYNDIIGNIVLNCATAAIQKLGANSISEHNIV